MKINLRNIVAGIATGVLFAITAVAPAAAEPMVDEKKLEVMAKEAKSAADHARVAKQYRLRAEAFELKAIEYDAIAGKEAKRTPLGAEVKWPAMGRNTGKQARDKAVQARRAAAENYELAARHAALSVEKRELAE
jgi:hypothetical protein